MRKMFSVLRTAIFAGAFLAAGPAALAVQYTYHGETGGLTIGMHTIIPGYQTGYFAVGQFHMTTSDAGWAPNLYTYCTDVGTLLATTHDYTPLDFTDPQATGVNPHWMAGGIQNAAKLFYNYNTASVTGVQKAGLQLAIWESLYTSNIGGYSDSDFFSSSNPYFYITSADSGNIGLAVDYAVGLLNNLNSASLTPPPNGLWLAPTENGVIKGSQGLLYPVSVPDAGSSLQLLGLALAALGVAARKLRSV